MSDFLQEGQERRRESRVPLRTAISYRHYESQGKIKNAINQNVSCGGLHLLSASPLRTQERIDLWILDPETDKLINLEGEVAWVAIDDLYGDSPYWVKAGVRFTYGETEQVDRLRHLVKKRGATFLTAEEKKKQSRISFAI